MSLRICCSLLALLLGQALGILSMPIVRAEENPAPYNSLVREFVMKMPTGGGYSTSSMANRRLRNAVSTENSKLLVNLTEATPSYCSEATFLVLLKTLSTLQSQGVLTLTPQTLAALKPNGQPDGTGIWGRWNANGPGTARLFYELGLGRNFTELPRAIPGDFLKIFWNDGIGSTEHGHSVIFLGTEEKNGVPHLRFWSSNIPGGYGEKSVPLSRIHRLLFSRLEHPENINRPILHTDSYLSSLERRSSTSSEMSDQCGILR
jgi:hypothetical protein